MGCILVRSPPLLPLNLRFCLEIRPCSGTHQAKPGHGVIINAQASFVLNHAPEAIHGLVASSLSAAFIASVDVQQTVITLAELAAHSIHGTLSNISLKLWNFGMYCLDMGRESFVVELWYTHAHKTFQALPAPSLHINQQQQSFYSHHMTFYRHISSSIGSRPSSSSMRGPSSAASNRWRTRCSLRQPMIAACLPVH